MAKKKKQEILNIPTSSGGEVVISASDLDKVKQLLGGKILKLVNGELVVVGSAPAK